MDAYDRKARLYPAACVVFPVTMLALLLLSLPEWWQSLVAFTAAGGLHALLIQFVRDLGVRQQNHLWTAWGGPPTTTHLRWKNATNLVRHKRLHEDVEAATGVPLPTAEAEAADPAAADDIYETAVGVLRERTRNPDEFPLVKAEVANYGFRRNLYGCRPFGIALAAVVALAEALLAILGWLYLVVVPPALMVAASLVSIVWLTGWVTQITPAFVKRDADRYAKALLSAAARVAAA